MSRTRLSLSRPLLSRAIQTGLARMNMDQNALAEALGVSHASVSDWVHMKKSPSADNLHRIMDVLRLSPADISPESAPAGVSDPRLLEDVVLVPRIARGRAADLLRSGGYINPGQGEFEGYDAFSRSEAHRLSGVNPDDLRTVTVVGDSLVPEILPGTRVAYVPHDRIEDFGMYVILVDDGVLVKRVQRYAGGAVEIIPINPAYCKEMLVPLQEADTNDLYRSQRTGLTAHFRVIGKVVFYTKTA